MGLLRSKRPRYAFGRRPASWIFIDKSQSPLYPVLLPESQATALELDHIFGVWPKDQLDRGVCGATDIYGVQLGPVDFPWYNNFAGLEGQKCIELRADQDYPNLREVGSQTWGEGPDAYAARTRRYFVPESQVLWAVEARRERDLGGGWSSEDQPVYAVVPDHLLETG